MYEINPKEEAASVITPETFQVILGQTGEDRLGFAQHFPLISEHLSNKLLTTDSQGQACTSNK